MPEDQKPNEGGEGTPSPKPDPFAELRSAQEALMQSISNMKAEFNRKLDSVKPTQAAPPKKAFDEILYENPDAAADHIADVATQKVLRQVQVQNNLKETEAYLMREFPEVKDQNGVLWKKADEIYRTYGIPDGSPIDPRLLKSAVQEAALELGTQPVSRRKKEVESDEFTGMSGGSAPKGGKGKGKLSDETKAWAQAFGLDMSNKETVERLEKRASRKSWLKYE